MKALGFLRQHKMKLNRKIFFTLAGSIVAILTAFSALTFSLFYQRSMDSARDSIDLVMQQNNSLVSSLITRVEEVMQAPSNDRQLYSMLNFEDNGSYVEQSVTKYNLNAYIINTLILPLRNYAPTATPHYYIPEKFPAEKLYRMQPVKDGYLHSMRLVEGKPWLEKALELDGAIYWFTKPEVPGKIFAAKKVYGFFEAVLTQEVGVLTMEMDISDLFSTVTDSNVTEHSAYFLTDPSGNWYSSTGLQRKDHEVISGFTYKDALQTVRFGQEDFLCRPSELSNGWYLVNLTPYRDVLKGTDFLINVYIVITVAGVIVATIASLYISGRTAKPIIQLSKTMLRVENEAQLELKVADPSNILEISQLYMSFQTLIDRVNALVADVHQKGENEKNAEIKALQAQISPHFLFNTLDSICWAARDTGDPNLPDIIVSLSEMLRYSLRDFDKLATIGQELAIVRQYLKIQQFCYSLDVTLIEDVGSVAQEYKLPKLTLQPLIENAILHGAVEHAQKSDVITLRAFHNGESVVIRVENNFPADIPHMYEILEDTTQVQKHGIKNVHSRLKMLFGEAYGLRFSESGSGGIIVEISLPG